MTEKRKKKAPLFLAAVAAAAALVGLILYCRYLGNGGVKNTSAVCCMVAGLVCEFMTLFLSGDFQDVPCILAPVLLAGGAGLELSDGIGNLADYFSGIICFGNPDLAPENIAITVVLLAAALIAILTCFMRKEA